MKRLASRLRSDSLSDTFVSAFIFQGLLLKQDLLLR